MIKSIFIDRNLMSIKVSLLLSILFICSSYLQGQNRKVILLNSRPIDPTRYQNIKGNPYLFDDFRLGKVFNYKFNEIDSVLINYNGYSHSFEVRQDDEYIDLDQNYYPVVVLYGEGGKEIFFRRHQQSPLSNRYSRLVYEGEKCMVFENFKVKKETTNVNYGGVDKTPKFTKKTENFILLDGELIKVPSKKKKILKILGNPPELVKNVKSNKLNLRKESDLIKALEFYDDLKSKQ